MWINQELFKRVLDENKATSDRAATVWNTCHTLQAQKDLLADQNAKQEVTIDWMRHRINALEKERAILLKEVTHLSYPVPEIALSQSAGPVKSGVFANVKTSNTLPGFDSLPSFEDIGDDLATAQGITHKEDGTLEYRD